MYIINIICKAVCYLLKMGHVINAMQIQAKLTVFEGYIHRTDHSKVNLIMFFNAVEDNLTVLDFNLLELYQC